LFVGVSFFFNSLLFPAVMLFVEQQRVLNVATVSSFVYMNHVH